MWKFLTVPIALCLSMAGVSEAQLLVNEAMPITHRVRLQPIIAMQSEEDGGAAATFFGNEEQQSTIIGYINSVWGQAGVAVEFLSENTYVNSFTYDGSPNDYSSTARPDDDMRLIVTDSNAPKSLDPTVLNMFFVNVIPGSPERSEFSATGISYIGEDGSVQYIGSGLLTFDAGLQAIASLISHEIGTNLGLPEIVEAENLMQSAFEADQGERLNSEQIAFLLERNSGSGSTGFFQAVPEPSHSALVAAGGLMVLSRRRRASGI